MLETNEVLDQVGFRQGTGIDHALAVFETVFGKGIEWNAEIYFANLDMTKAFDRVEHNQVLFRRLRLHPLETSSSGYVRSLDLHRFSYVVEKNFGNMVASSPFRLPH